MQHLQRFMAFLREASLIHEHHTTDGQLKLDVVTLTINGTREHCLYLIGSSVVGTLVEVWVKGFKEIGVTKVLFYRLFSL